MLIRGYSATGKSLEDFRADVAVGKIKGVSTVRVVNQDGVALMATRDYRVDRVNVEVYNGIVTNCNIG